MLGTFEKKRNICFLKKKNIIKMNSVEITKLEVGLEFKVVLFYQRLNKDIKNQ